MQRQTQLELIFPLIRLKHRILASVSGPEFAIYPGDPQHECWWAMQDAYYKHLCGSEALNAALSRTVENDSCTNLAISVAERLKAFEN